MFFSKRTGTRRKAAMRASAGTALCFSFGVILYSVFPAGCSSHRIGAILCGDNIAQGREICDGTDLKGETCESLGLGSGVLACLPDCSGFNTSGCFKAGECGNNIAEYDEACDGTDLRSETCASFGFNSGQLACLSDCSDFDISGCYNDLTLLTWITIPGSTFQMGSYESTFENPIRWVTVETFQMTKSQITVNQYSACNGDRECSEPGQVFPCNWSVSDHGQHPVNCVTWYQARKFCEWAGGRLPSEAEWEYAARSGGRIRTYPWGDTPPTCESAVMNIDGPGCGTNRTWPVCEKWAGNTDQGLCDMAGNVLEWVEDDWHNGYYGAPTDGSPWLDNPRGWLRVLRGGAYNNFTDALRAAYRTSAEPNSIIFGEYRGFRCVRDNN